ncbi:hypothetical protein EV359DRAFT_69072, partial [Lentinula novae-zelandiae]
MISSSVITVLDDDDPLNESIISAWIKTGKKATSKDIPPDVTAYLTRTKALPQTALRLLPAEGISVMQLLKFPLPTIQGSLVQPKAGNWFSERPANCVDPSVLFNQPIPPKQFIETLLKTQDQAVLDGCLSISNPNHPAQRFPLFTSAFLDKIHLAILAQSDWRHSLDWLNQRTEDNTYEETAVAHQLLQIMPWNCRINLTFSCTLSTTLLFSRFLSERWMTSSLIDLMLGQLSDCLEEDHDLEAQVALEPLRFMEYLQNPHRHETPLGRIAFGMEKKSVVLFVSHWSKQRHWLAFRAMITEGKVTYADGIEDNTRPKGLLARATNWFSDHFGRKFTAPDPGNVLTHGTQDDFNNCGLVVINAIEHALWNDTEIWSSEMKELHRVHWFNILTKAFLQQEGCAFPEPNQTINAMNISSMLNPELPLSEKLSTLYIPVIPDPRLQISSLIHPIHTSIRESMSLSERPRKRSHSPEFGENAVQAMLPSKPEDEDSDFVITDNSDETDSVATVATDDGLYVKHT